MTIPSRRRLLLRLVVCKRLPQRLLEEKMDGLGAQKQTFVVSMVLRSWDWAKISVQ